MIKYVKITRYMNGDIREQIQEVIDNNAMDKDTRLFFEKRNMFCAEDLCKLLLYFDIKFDDNINNMVLVPNEWFIKKYVDKKNKFFESQNRLSY